MGRQLHLRQHYVFLLEPIHAPSGEVMAWELLTRCMQGNESAVQADADSGHRLFDRLLEAEKWQLFLLQLERIDALYQSGFSSVLSLNIDSDIIRGILNNHAVQQKLDQLPLLRLEISAFFTARYHAADRLLLQKLAGITPALLWLDDFGAGSSTLSMLSSGIVEYVKISRSFFWKYGTGYAFDTLLNHVNDFCKGVIIQGVDTQQQLEMATSKQAAGLQGRCWNTAYLDDFIDQSVNVPRSGALKNQRSAITHYRNFL